jgi:protein ImuA
MPSPAVLSELRSQLAALALPGPVVAKGHVGLGIAALDAFLGSGLVRAALHEVGSQGTADLPAAMAFALGVAMRAARQRPILWVRQDAFDGESGHPHPAGLAELGFNPGRFLLVKAPDAAGVLRAAGEGVRCPALGALLIQPWGEPPILDLTASRRLALAAGASGVMTLMVRTANAGASAAHTRWLVASRPSHALEANAPGQPALTIRLVRHRGGLAEREWQVAWDRERGRFQAMPEPSILTAPKPKPHVPPLSRPVVSLPADGSPETGRHSAALRQAG